MTRSERLRPVVHYSNEKERDAAQVMARHREAVRTQEQRLQELEQYRLEYERMLAAEQAGVAGERMARYRAFISRISQAIEYQRGQLDTAQRSYEEKKLAWLALRSRRQALDKVVEHYRDEERRDESLREQKELDDCTSRDASRKEHGM